MCRCPTPVSDDPHVRAAWRAAAGYARRYAGQFRRADPGEVLGAAWEAANDGRPAAYGVADYLRRYGPLPRPGRIDRRAAALAGDPPEGPGRDGADPLLALWADTRAERLAAGWKMRERVWLYLILVEGLSVARVAAAWGVTPSAIWQKLTAHPDWPPSGIRPLNGRIPVEW